ncbi:methyl-accepting chemotaxis protein [Aneurinibacillus aneurinilyticus]|uniref:methyl-accepting chemotaxis protein n=1 Tax=Aneurinibacillus aneurinilyticus TaxID=1391 RepID=UPI0003FB448C|nr:methyl-accepting chemotaxis protein [Aneurinibacillus aneurinilyticus]MCI1693757.1 methyl-accepting chemotaxis protein [Aneurinibacillus aneurinilyticus]MED0709080.1 methyl-accepting chemotaxis protein [Aneurinibacillus aneurinilyticus]MED0725474.1 methyl-accepting chemotaxis protein [Aneurinibacillus aneurinilyticus]MED0730785.1 methyl-accepting chemotaxis protein [Aneurinibacillus aneurinilyticus]MED0740871.1 methyl-accepting chemotaxis protein [Aneurinibacillus aneurinilyticus]
MFQKINNMSIKLKLTATILLITLIPLMASGFLSYHSAYDSVYDMTVQDLKYMTKVKAEEIAAYTKDGHVDAAMSEKIKALVDDVETSYYKANGLSGYAYIIDDQGKVLYHPDPQMIGTSLANESFAQEILKEKTGYITYPWKGEEKVASFSQLPNGWELVIGSYLKDMMKPLLFIRNQMFVISLVSSLLAIVIGYVIVHMLTKPMKELVQAMEKAEAGDVTVQVTPGSKDEVGQLTHMFNEMIREFRNMLRQVHEVSEQVAASSEQLTASANESTRASEQISEASQEIASGSEGQMESVRATTEALHEMSGNIQSIADKIQAVKHDSSTVVKYAHTGESSLKKVIWEMNDISEKVSNTEVQIRELGNRSEAIKGIIGTIHEISEQTNLLALNAAIEAARAGEQGKSFAVVAQEIRKLAEQSGKSAREIAMLISDIHAKIGTAVTSMGESSKAVSEGRSVVEEAGQSFSSILKAIADLNKQIELVTASSKTISEGTEHIVRQGDEISRLASIAAADTQEVAAASEEQTATMEEINAASEMLAKMAEELQAHVSRFKIS